MGILIGAIVGMQLASLAAILAACFVLYPAINLCGSMGLPAAPLGAIAGGLRSWLVAGRSIAAMARSCERTVGFQLENDYIG
jgi:hypothetical protein